MAELCLTRNSLGTTPLGLYRGVSLKAASQKLHPSILYLRIPSQLAKSAVPAIIFVGLKPNCPLEWRDKMIGYGWELGKEHTVVVLDADPEGKWVDIADPTNGIEWWPAEQLHWLWDGYALALRHNPATSTPNH